MRSEKEKPLENDMKKNSKIFVEKIVFKGLIENIIEDHVTKNTHLGSVKG